MLSTLTGAEHIVMIKAQFIGYYSIYGPNGIIVGKQYDDVIEYSSRLLKAWPYTIAKKPYRNIRGKWTIKLETDMTRVVNPQSEREFLFGATWYKAL